MGGESEEAGLEIFNAKFLPSLGSLDHSAGKIDGIFIPTPNKPQ